MKRNKIIALTAALTLLSSCNIYRTFKSPQVEAKEVAGEAFALPDSAEQLLSWRALFSDPQLQELIEQGLQANSDLRIAQLNIEQCEAALLAAKLSYLPSLALAPTTQVSHSDAGTVQGYNLPIKAQWEIDLFGRIRNTKQQAQATLLQSEEYAKLVQTQLVSALANSYYTLLMLDEQLRISNRNLENMEKNVEIMVALKAAGMQTEAAVNQAKANLYNVAVSVKELEKQVIEVETATSLLLNTPSHTIARSSYATAATPTAQLEEAISLTALVNRPDVKRAEYALRHSFYTTNVARSAFYPAISITGSAGWVNNSGMTLNPSNMLYNALASLTQPLFNKGANIANLKVAKSKYEQSLISFEKSLLVAGSEVHSALVSCETSEEKMALRKEQVAASEKALANSQALMKHSSKTYLEVLVAENTLLSAQLSLAAEWFDGVRGHINLYKALGGGVE